ncbi:hypothetical protein [Streptomyces fructofermentans]|uniref:Uncharacterized protein n=1 Tax=Streptomyces fructofermentans TaxID=152141 RepID=A0A918KAT2_9ACTN|nr:hypothetical protein [Streptomyces fructofermentans]GGX57073.1 hypothetical protein GCM10010515_25750 [Streptomyces fructofermentans]
MPQDQSADTGVTSGGAPLRTWLTRGKYLLIEVVALTPLLGIGGVFLGALSAFPCMSPGSEPEASDHLVRPAAFDPVPPIAGMVLVALAVVAVWGAYHAKQMVVKTQAVLALVAVVAALVLHDPHPTCVRGTNASVPAGLVPPPPIRS